MIKLQTTSLKHLPQSNFNLLKNIITVDGKKFDLNKPESITEDSESPVYRLNEEIIIKLNIPKNKMFMFRYGNLLRFFDKDMNGLIDVPELKIALGFISMEKEEEQAGLKVIHDAFFNPRLEQDMTKKEINQLWWDKGFKKVV